MLTMFMAEELSFQERNVYSTLGKKGAKKIPSAGALTVLAHLKLCLATLLVSAFVQARQVLYH